MILFWIIVFIVSLWLMIKGADWLLIKAEKIGISLGLSPFVVGVIIVGLGTSFPELAAGLTATFKGATEIVSANAIGSNIANILLVVGIASIVGKRLVVTKNLIDLDLPLLATGTVFFVLMAMDGEVVFFESILMLFLYAVYISYTVMFKPDEEISREDIYEVDQILPARPERRGHKKFFAWREENDLPPTIIYPKDVFVLMVGIIFLVIGSKYMIDSVLAISALLNLATGAIAISAVAVGTSLPEIMVTAKAAWKKDGDVAIGNIFGSNVFNMFAVVGIPGLLSTIRLDEPTLLVGLPAMAVVTLLFVISGISRHIHAWEGFFYLTLYLAIMGKLFGLF